MKKMLTSSSHPPCFFYGIAMMFVGLWNPNRTSPLVPLGSRCWAGFHNSNSNHRKRSEMVGKLLHFNDPPQTNWFEGKSQLQIPLTSDYCQLWSLSKSFRSYFMDPGDLLQKPEKVQWRAANNPDFRGKKRSNKFQKPRGNSDWWFQKFQRF